MPVLAPIPVINSVAVADVEALLAAIPPDRELHEPGEDLREAGIELPRVNFAGDQTNDAGAAAWPVTAGAIRVGSLESAQDPGPVQEVVDQGIDRDQLHAKKGIIWAHNSHIGDATATEMSARGEHNLGEFCRKEFGENCYAIGFGTDHGKVAAASDWGGPMEIKDVRSSVDNSVERLCHESETPHFMLCLRDRDAAHTKGLLRPRLERAIGVIYRPESELASHYFEAVLPGQFDEYIWFDESREVSPLKTHELSGLPDTYPFGL